MTNNNNVEVEVKFLVAELAPVEEKLTAAGAQQVKDRVFEQNIRFDTADDALHGRLELLRLRRDTAVTLTFKGPTDADARSEARVREEIEVTVNDFANMLAIIKRLGLQPVQTYEKYRQTWQLDDVEIVLDELPYGHFVELEGREQDLRPAAEKLGLDWEARLLTNYLAIMGQVQEMYDLPFNDLTFANFADLDLDIDMTAVLQAEIPEQ